ncbi:DUF6134 family protein [Fulvivirga lutea]|uniref:Uncharacterized protein n=1 Tax=Fulvivirga lutea TaxID=2810512 RepID=A0A975A0I4_9BACT|nr:DUF6134 family protein [Fulvivirga lutea]QSE96462.1 hypothetical protein JR347_12730 [Fulvivirga lutea]
MPKIICIIFLTALICFSISSSGQKYNYSIHLAGGKIGGINATLTEENGVQYYEIESDVTFKVLFKKYNRRTIHKVTFSDGSIDESYTAVYMNKNQEDSASLVHISNHQYLCFMTEKDERYKKNFGAISFPSAMLYYKEPKGVSKVFSERFLDYCPVEVLEEGKYMVYLPNGKENVYTYKNGELISVFIDRTWFNIEFRKM